MILKQHSLIISIFSRFMTRLQTIPSQGVDEEICALKFQKFDREFIGMINNNNNNNNFSIP